MKTSFSSVHLLVQTGEKSQGLSDESDYDDNDDDDDDDDHGFSGRGQPLHLLQRQHQIGLIPDIEWWDAPLLQKCADNDYQLGGNPDFPYVILEVLCSFVLHVNIQRLVYVLVTLACLRCSPRFTSSVTIMCSLIPSVPMFYYLSVLLMVV